MSAAGREAAEDYSSETAVSSGSRGSLGVLGSVAAGLGLAGAILAIVAWFSVIIKIQVLTVTPATFTGNDRSGIALLLLGAFAILMIVGSVRGARPAMAALAAVGLTVLLIAVLRDLPHLNDTNVWQLHDAYEDAQAVAGSGYYLETAAGILMLVSGVALLMLGPRVRRVRRGPKAATVSAPPSTSATPAPAAAAPPPPAAGPRVPAPDEDPDYQPRSRPQRRRSGGIVGRLRRRD
jgi:hypothetical protein